MQNIQVSMTKDMYDILLNGKKKSSDDPGFRGCGTPDKVAAYVRQAWGLLGFVTDIVIE